MGRRNGRQVFLPGVLALGELARRGGGRHGAEGRGGRPLNAGVHVRFVVQTDVHEVVPPLQGPGQGLQADVGRAAVAGDGHDRHALVGDLAFTAHGLAGGFHAGSHGAGVFKGHVNPRHAPGGLGIGRGADFHAARGRHRHHARADGFHQHAQGGHFAAALTGPVPRSERFIQGHGLGRVFLEILQVFGDHSNTPTISNRSWPLSGRAWHWS